jgi:YbgC/YbaW family acyl-CoA thioester hydrolase
MPAITLKRRIQWIDTDAAGRWHFTTAFRLAEEAEAELHRSLGVADLTFGRTPRRKVECEFLVPLKFDDEIDVTLSVEKVGRTSVTYALSLERDGEVAARGSLVMVYIDPGTEQAVELPEPVRRALSQ